MSEIIDSGMEWVIELIFLFKNGENGVAVFGNFFGAQGVIPDPKVGADKRVDRNVIFLENSSNLEIGMLKINENGFVDRGGFEIGFEGF